MNVYRVDHHYFHGFRVCVKRRGQRFQAYLSDGHPARRREALATAMSVRNALVAQLPRLTKVKRTYVLNKTGVVGVSLATGRTPKGTPVRYYIATWFDIYGRRHKRSFSVLKYGADKARRLAIRARLSGIAWAKRPSGSTSSPPRR